MKIVHVKQTFHTLPGQGNNTFTKYLGMLNDFFKPFMNSFTNISYVGTYHPTAIDFQMIFSVNNSENIFLRVYGGSDTSSNPCICFFVSNSGDPTVGGIDSNADPDRYDLNVPKRISIIPGIGDAALFDFWIYYIDDDNGNLQVIWTPNPSFGAKDYSNPFILNGVRTSKNKNVFVKFPPDDQAIQVYDFDDTNRVRYFIPQDATSYTSETDLIKSTFLPIRNGGGLGDGSTDLIPDKLVHIYNTKLNSVYVQTVNNNSKAFVRRLVRVGNKYYRQLVSNWWFEDPNGDELPVREYTDENPYPTPSNNS